MEGVLNVACRYSYPLPLLGIVVWFLGFFFFGKLFNELQFLHFIFLILFGWDSLSQGRGGAEAEN